eukprot:TRINITY_DN7176_c0_g1_i2.p1 TRINITY_DN7176_c0_g1~~TRINITY_DN7176_c0_g1_i2.p1  ORF type:complete len:570 (+),score=103.39 TRINITY_DN7176_c0_g1_i2:132-1841(+)
MSCNGCRVLRKGCNEGCVLRPCLAAIEGSEAQANATLFLAKFFGRAGLLAFISAVKEHQRPAVFQSLLYEACGRTINPVYGAAGLLWCGQWNVCQAAVVAVLKGTPLSDFASTINVIQGGPPMGSSPSGSPASVAALGASLPQAVCSPYPSTVHTPSNVSSASSSLPQLPVSQPGIANSPAVVPGSVKTGPSQQFPSFQYPMTDPMAMSYWPMLMSMQSQQGIGGHMSASSMAPAVSPISNGVNEMAQAASYPLVSWPPSFFFPGMSSMPSDGAIPGNGAAFAHQHMLAAQELRNGRSSFPLTEAQYFNPTFVHREFMQSGSMPPASAVATPALTGTSFRDEGDIANSCSSATRTTISSSSFNDACRSGGNGGGSIEAAEAVTAAFNSGSIGGNGGAAAIGWGGKSNIVGNIQAAGSRKCVNDNGLKGNSLGPGQRTCKKQRSSSPPLVVPVARRLKPCSGLTTFMPSFFPGCCETSGSGAAETTESSAQQGSEVAGGRRLTEAPREESVGSPSVMDDVAEQVPVVLQSRPLFSIAASGNAAAAAVQWASCTGTEQQQAVLRHLLPLLS